MDVNRQFSLATSHVENIYRLWRYVNTLWTWDDGGLIVFKPSPTRPSVAEFSGSQSCCAVPIFSAISVSCWWETTCSGLSNWKYRCHNKHQLSFPPSPYATKTSSGITAFWITNQLFTTTISKFKMITFTTCLILVRVGDFQKAVIPW